MAIKVLNKAAFDGDYGLNGDIGGLPRTNYYTPDGRTIQAIPQIREFVRKDKDGNIIGTGKRDANLDKGWLLTKPIVLKLYCRWCTTWHDTVKEINACGASQQKFIKQAEFKAKKEETQRTKSLEDKITELEAKMAKLMEAKVG